MSHLDTLTDAWVDGQEALWADRLGMEQAHQEWEERALADCKCDLRHSFLHNPDVKHHQFSSYTVRQLVDEAMDPDKHYPMLLELIRRAALGEDISDDAGDLVLELANKCVDSQRETFLRD